MHRTPFVLYHLDEALASKPREFKREGSVFSAVCRTPKVQQKRSVVRPRSSLGMYTKQRKLLFHLNSNKNAIKLLVGRDSAPVGPSVLSPRESYLSQV
jgi:hypothetical protein